MLEFNDASVFLALLLADFDLPGVHTQKLLQLAELLGQFVLAEIAAPRDLGQDAVDLTGEGFVVESLFDHLQIVQHWARELIQLSGIVDHIVDERVVALAFVDLLVVRVERRIFRVHLL